MSCRPLSRYVHRSNSREFELCANWTMCKSCRSCIKACKMFWCLESSDLLTSKLSENYASTVSYIYTTTTIIQECKNFIFSPGNLYMAILKNKTYEIQSHITVSAITLYGKM